MEDKVKSPCNGKCTIKKGVCCSCKRTRNEIGAWTGLSEKDKQEIVDDIKNR
jgi:predicted Fe-S protein YdhL (DUF1289 family)